MDLSRVIIGPVVTEKAEGLKGQRTYMFKVVQDATKIDVKSALLKFYDAHAQSVRIIRVVPKFRDFRGGVMQKRHPFKKVIVTLAPKSKSLDIASFKI